MSLARTEIESPTSRARRAQILDATFSVIHECGFSSTTLARVAENAGISVGSVSFHFKSKDALLIAVLSQISDEFEREIHSVAGEAGDPAGSLRAVGRACLADSLCEPRKIAVWYAFVAESRARDRYTELCGQRDARFGELLRGHFQALLASTPGSDRSAEAAARGFEGLIDGFWQERLFDPARFDRRRAMQCLEDYLALVCPPAAGGTGIGGGADPASEPAAGLPGVDPAGLSHLAPWTYSNREVYQLEVAQIFHRNWLMVGHVSEAAKPGDYLTFEGFGERAFVLRGDDGELRAFHNVCRHRGSALVSGKTGHCRAALVCPFHGWTYTRDGALKNVPGLNKFDGIEKHNLGLVGLELEIWNGFVFISFGSPERSVAEELAPVDELVSHYRLADLEPLGESYFEERDINWKVFHDIDNEGYHVPVGHPGLHALFGRDYGDSDWSGIPVSRGGIQGQSTGPFSVRAYQKLMPRYAHLPEHHQRSWYYFGLMPNLVFELYPDLVGFYTTLPLGPNRTRVWGRYYGLEDSRREARACRYLVGRINRETGDEDAQFVDTIQSGMTSSAFPAPLLSSIESGVVAAHRYLARRIPVMCLPAAPAEGTVEQVNSRLRAAL